MINLFVRFGIAGRLVAIAAFVFGYMAGAHAIDLGTGVLPLRHTSGQAIPLDRDDELRIVGKVDTAAPLLIVLRIDDGKSHSYATRYNEERTFPPGRFEWTIPLRGLLTATGRLLDPSDLRGVYLFTSGAGAGRVFVERFGTSVAPRLPDGVRGYALGAATAPLPPGFDRIAPGDVRIESGRPVAVRRPAPDPLLANGVRGLERLRLPWAGDRARVSLWTEDPGEWELLPHALQRRIRINGSDVLSEHLSPSQWVSTRYLRGAAVEHRRGDDAWTAYGRARGGRVTSVVDVVDGAIVIELAGESAAALYLAGVVIEPAQSTVGLDHVNAWRAAWYRQTWPVVAADAETGAPPVAVVIGSGKQEMLPVRIVAAPGIGVRARFAVSSQMELGAARFDVEVLTLGKAVADMRVWVGVQRLERRRANDTVLSFSDNMLVAAGASLSLTANRSRTLEAWIDVPAGADAGIWHGALTITHERGSMRIPVRVDVLPVNLPPVAKPAGFYLDEAPHLTWFAATRADRALQTACDLALMQSFGINGTAPALSTPQGSPSAFNSDMAAARVHGVAQPVLAYAPAKRLAGLHGLRGSASIIASTEAAFAADDRAPPVWSVADEPSNPGHSAIDLAEWLKVLRADVPRARLAAHLNAPLDIDFAHLFDVVLVNDGYGLDLARLEATRARSKDLWLYNTARPRATAGLWLWRSPASRYVQWHGRMPTADPFDPTDGREGDVQVVFPSLEPCPRQPTIHRDLLDMADGLVDQRWLLWLAQQTEDDAKALVASIRAKVPTWGAARGLNGGDLANMRESIIEIAKRRGRG